MELICLLLLTSILFGHVTTRSIDVTTREGQWEYFVVYKHTLKLPHGVQPSEEQLSEAIEDFQRFFRLKITGEMNAETMDVMKRNRCGFSDPNLPARQFVIATDKWRKDTVTWSLNRIPSEVDYPTMKNIIREALQAWAPYVPFKLEEAPSGTTGDIEIDFLVSNSEGEHGDGFPFFDHTVAHAFFPGSRDLSGDVHFNLKKTFTYSDSFVPSYSYSAKLIAVHELGHALGLDHSGDFNAIMYPIVKKGVKFYFLDIDDIAGMTARYSNFVVAVNKSPRNARSTIPLILSSLCITYKFWKNNKLL